MSELGQGNQLGWADESCGACESRLWPGDRYCRHCGARDRDPSAPTVHEITLTEPGTATRPGEFTTAAAGYDGAAPSETRSSASTRATLIGGGLAAAVMVALVVIGSITGDRELVEPAPTPMPTSTPFPTRDFPESIFSRENPPERQAALDAFGAAYARDNQPVGDVLAAAGVDGELVVLDGEQIVRVSSGSDRPETSELASTISPAESPWGDLGPAEAASYRISPTARAVIDRWDPDFSRWAPAAIVLTGSVPAVPFTAVAVSPTHLAAEAGGYVRVWSQATDAEVAQVTGRLIASTGPGFLVSECGLAATQCFTRLFDAAGSPTGERIAASVFAPSVETVARVSPDAKRVAFVKHGELVVWEFNDGGLNDGDGVVLRAESTAGPIVDVAWLPNGAGLAVITPTELAIRTLDQTVTRIPVDLVDARTLSFVPGGLG